MRIPAFVAITALAAVGLAVPANAQASTAATDTITVRLAPADASAYKTLVTAAGLSRADRRERLARALPSAVTRQRVESVLLSQGLRIVGETDWTVTAAAAAPVAHDFMTANKGRGMTGSDTSPQGAALDTGPLAGLVTHIVDRAAVHIRNHPLFTPAVVDGANVRSLYHAPVGLPGSAAPLTLATIQFSGWNAADLTAYATQVSLPDPVLSGQYVSISVQGADPTVPDATEGNVEVALDQESILATAPNVKQRAYFATNGDATAYISALEQVATDATAHPELGIAALSISWGDCEDMTDPSAMSYYQAIDAAFQDISAAGVTIFAASGDSGSLGCGPDKPIAVDFPASDPYVVGVGGTTADAALSQEQGWIGSGGGESIVWNRPKYQTTLGLAGTHRLVPDIAAVGDPNSGFSIVAGGQPALVGGTSLASPLAAATFTSSLAARGFTAGVGFIHANLYGAPAAAFRDVTVGNNGFPAGPGYDMVTGRGAPLWNLLFTAIDGTPVLTAAAYSPSRTVPLHVAVPTGMQFAGWKVSLAGTPTCDWNGATLAAPVSIVAPADGARTVFVEGLASNGYCYNVSRSVVVDTVRPVAVAAATKTATTVRMSWHATDALPGSGVASYTVTVKRSRTTIAVFSAVRTTSTGTSFRGVRGATYTLTVRATDKAGNTSVAATRTVTV